MNAEAMKLEGPDLTVGLGHEALTHSSEALVDKTMSAITASVQSRIGFSKANTKVADVLVVNKGTELINNGGKVGEKVLSPKRIWSEINEDFTAEVGKIEELCFLRETAKSLASFMGEKRANLIAEQGGYAAIRSGVVFDNARELGITIQNAAQELFDNKTPVLQYNREGVSVNEGPWPFGSVEEAKTALIQAVETLASQQQLNNLFPGKTTSNFIVGIVDAAKVNLGASSSYSPMQEVPEAELDKAVKKAHETLNTSVQAVRDKDITEATTALQKVAPNVGAILPDQSPAKNFFTVTNDSLKSALENLRQGNPQATIGELKAGIEDKLKELSEPSLGKKDLTDQYKTLSTARGYTTDNIADYAANAILIEKGLLQADPLTPEKLDRLANEWVGKSGYPRKFLGEALLATGDAINFGAQILALLISGDARYVHEAFDALKNARWGQLRHAVYDGYARVFLGGAQEKLGKLKEELETFKGGKTSLEYTKLKKEVLKLGEKVDMRSGIVAHILTGCARGKSNYEQLSLGERLEKCKEISAHKDDKGWLAARTTALEHADLAVRGGGVEMNLVARRQEHLRAAIESITANTKSIVKEAEGLLSDKTGTLFWKINKIEEWEIASLSQLPFSEKYAYAKAVGDAASDKVPDAFKEQLDLVQHFRTQKGPEASIFEHAPDAVRQAMIEKYVDALFTQALKLGLTTKELEAASNVSDQLEKTKETLGLAKTLRATSQE